MAARSDTTPAAERDASRLRRVQSFAAAALFLCVFLTGARMSQVHDQTWDWRLAPAAAPTRLVVNGHAYLRSGRADAASDASEPTTPGGVTAGGGLILLPMITRPGSSLTSLTVQDGNGLWTYSMLGGG